MDLSQVSSGDSAGLAVLIEWLAAARARKVRLRYTSVPTQILAVARISDIEELLTVTHGAGRQRRNSQTRS